MIQTIVTIATKVFGIFHANIYKILINKIIAVTFNAIFHGFVLKLESRNCLNLFTTSSNSKFFSMKCCSRCMGYIVREKENFSHNQSLSFTFEILLIKFLSNVPVKDNIARSLEFLQIISKCNGYGIILLSTWFLPAGIPPQSFPDKINLKAGLILYIYIYI